VSDIVNILLVSPDPRFRAELETTIASLDGLNPVVQHAADARQAIEAARSRRPQVALMEMGPDIGPLQAFAEEASVVSPETTVAAVFRPDGFGADVSESAILILAIRAGVKDFLRRPVSTTELAELLRRTRRGPSQIASRMGRVICFVSNKGGVGKSTTAVNAACGLALRHPNRVLLVDASLQMGVCASLLDLAPTTSLMDVVREADRLDEILLRQLAVPHASGLHLLAAPDDAVAAAEINDEIISRLLTLARRTYDFVIVDTFPMLDRAIVAVLDHSDRAYVVLENVVPTVLGGVKFLEVLKSLGVSSERQRVVLNRYTTLPGSVKPAEVANRLGHSVDHVIPFDKGIVVAANTGEPYVMRRARWLGCGRQLRQLVDEIDAMREEVELPLAASNNGQLSARAQADRAEGQQEEPS
jgi:pilus assembly protein CpaE